MKRVIWALLSMALAGASFAPKAAADVTMKVNAPFAGEWPVNPCNLQDVTFSGVFHLTITETQSSSSNINFDVHLNWSDVKGTDHMENSYVVHNSGNSEEHFSGAYSAEVETFTHSFEMVTTGSVLNFQVKALFHITINPDGSITSFVTSSSETCVG
jgi:hypothetical protein